MSGPWTRKHQILFNVMDVLGEFLDREPIGQVACSGAPTTNRDDVRPETIGYFSRQRLPEDQFEPGPTAAIPEVVFEVRGVSESWTEMYRKIVRHLESGVLRVCVLDEPTRIAQVFLDEDPGTVCFAAEEDLTIPDVLPGFAMKVERFFE